MRQWLCWLHLWAVRCAATVCNGDAGSRSKTGTIPFSPQMLLDSRSSSSRLIVAPGLSVGGLACLLFFPALCFLPIENKQFSIHASILHHHTDLPNPMRCIHVDQFPVCGLMKGSKNYVYNRSPVGFYVDCCLQIKSLYHTKLIRIIELWELKL